MRLIKYNDSAFSLRYEFPSNWNAQNITGVNVTITDVDGTSLVASTAATLYTATTTNAAATVGSNTITLAATAAAVSPGDNLEIAASVDGPTEKVTVLSYNSSTKVATLERELRYAHTTGTAVKGLWCTYSLSTATTDTWILGLQVLIDWTPNTDDMPGRELGEVVLSAFGPSDLLKSFKIRYPSQYDSLVDNFDGLMKEAMNDLSISLESRGLLIDRIQDQAKLKKTLCDLIRRMIVFSGGDRSEREQIIADNEYTKSFEEIARLPLWSDDDQDGVESEGEVDDHSPEQNMSFERGI